MSSIQNSVREESLKKAREALKEKRVKEKMEQVEKMEATKKRKREDEEEKHENIDTNSIVALPVPVAPIPERKTIQPREEEKEESLDVDSMEEPFPSMEKPDDNILSSDTDSNMSWFKNKTQEYTRDFPEKFKSGAKSCISSLCWSAAFAGLLVVRYMVQSRVQDAVGRLAASYQKNDDDISDSQNSDKPNLPIETQNLPTQTPKTTNFSDFMR